MPQDFVHIGRGFSDNWKKTAIYTGGILGLVLVYRYTTEFYQDEIERIIDYKLPNVSPRKKLPFVLDELLEHNDAYITYSPSCLKFNNLERPIKSCFRLRPEESPICTSCLYGEVKLCI